MTASKDRQLWLVGATQGIGAGLSERLAESFDVRGFSRSSGDGAGDDFGDAETAARLVEDLGAPWAWVHTPGSFFEKPLLETSDEEWEGLMTSNLMSFVRSARSILPAMAAAGGGRVVCFGVAGLTVDTGKTKGPAYFAVKAALLSSVRSLARDFAPAGVCINMISPGAIAHERSHRASQERVLPKIPMGRLGEPRDFCGLVDYLVSAESAYVTGQEICVDGGLALGPAAL